jgi:hypothetical protein
MDVELNAEMHQLQHPRYFAIAIAGMEDKIGGRAQEIPASPVVCYGDFRVLWPV